MAQWGGSGGDGTAGNTAGGGEGAGEMGAWLREGKPQETPNMEMKGRG